MADLEFTHRRKNPLSGDWVLVSPQRNNRPWQGATEASEQTSLPSYDANCPLCSGNQRANNVTNPEYQGTFVFTNDFGALNPTHQAVAQDSKQPLFMAEAASGECRVICFSDQHNVTLPELPLTAIEQLVNTWQLNYQELAKQYRCVHIFENKGAVMGCSQPHPHGQIWAHDHLSSEIALEDVNQQAYFAKHGRALLGDYVDHEIEAKQRIVFENQHWLVVVPYWAAWPFETLVVAKEDIRHFGQMTQAHKASLAEAIKVLTTKYDNLFNCSFPYSMGWHNAPSQPTQDDSHWRLHGHFYPPLLRSATVKKHMVGYEMLAESQRDLTAETAATLLQQASSIHYKQGSPNE
ncbi:UDP-glucose--hexose-1-phosphate uridylyltransferase [Shewanella sp. UCD-KL21]|uniref:UDP-glucose--hexose-1-phosphate uridylyltransferase n=1 Tax=Shewanella sp. UCD-KL21 TaxID=1917164 RepID=UPI000970A74B|nr:UDP-glucose--hexose-1-phosphate uridylyltransferase [Shewanella sp. UCD-KL21]